MAVALSSPTSVDDVLNDGFLSCLRRDEGLSRFCGENIHIGFVRNDAGYSVTLSGNKRSVEVTGTIIGMLSATRDCLEWLEPYPQFEFLDTASPDSALQAARTIFGPGNLYLVPHDDGSADIVIVSFEQQPHLLLDLKETLIRGIARLPKELSLERALLGFAALENLPVSVSDATISFDCGIVVDLQQRRIVSPLNIHQVVADSFYLSVEHQLFFDGVHGNARVSFDASTSTATVTTNQGSFQSHGIIVAYISHGHWSFAYGSNPKLQRLYQFAHEFAIPELLESTTVDNAQALGLDHAAKRILRHWTHVFISVSPDTNALLLLDAPQLRLPAPSPHVQQAVWAVALPASVDAERARTAYSELRGI